MSVLIDHQTRVIVQGITGHHGSFHAAQMLEYGTNVVAGVTPKKGGTFFTAGLSKIPVYNSVKEALIKHDADYSIIFVPADHAMDAALEAIENDLHPVIITEHIPLHDSLTILQKAREKKLKVIGPNCPGIITPSACKIGIMPGNIFIPGPVGVLSRSGTLTYEIVRQLSDKKIGQSTVIGIGGDMVHGLGFMEGLQAFENDPDTRLIVLIGEIGGEEEERAAVFIREHVNKPIIGYVVGKNAPPGKTMGHAGAVISGTNGTYEAKIEALEKAGVLIAGLPHDVPRLASQFL